MLPVCLTLFIRIVQCFVPFLVAEISVASYVWEYFPYSYPLPVFVRKKTPKKGLNFNKFWKYGYLWKPSKGDNSYKTPVLKLNYRSCTPYINFKFEFLRISIVNNYQKDSLSFIQQYIFHQQYFKIQYILPIMQCG